MTLIASYITEIMVPLALVLIGWGTIGFAIIRAFGLKASIVYLAISALICVSVAFIGFEYAARPHHANRYGAFYGLFIATIATSWSIICLSVIAFLKAQKTFYSTKEANKCLS